MIGQQEEEAVSIPETSNEAAEEAVEEAEKNMRTTSDIPKTVMILISQCDLTFSSTSGSYQGL